MKTVEYRNPELKGTLLPTGLWQDEPDKVQWPDEKTGLPCLAVRNRMGAWCGYVGISPENPLHGKDYMDLDVEVHGGLTFASSCDKDADEAHGICHVAEPDEPEPVWWFGFDCAHVMDLCPRASLVPIGSGPEEIYRDLNYVRAEVAKLAIQLWDPV